MKLIAIWGLLVLTACSSAAPAGTDRPESQDILLLKTSAGSVALDLHSRERRPIPEPFTGVPGGSMLFASVREEEGTRVVQLDPRSDTSRDVAMIPGDFEVAVASGDGKAVALIPAGSKGVTEAAVEGRSRTELVHLQSSGSTRNFDLVGNFQPEAFSTDGTRLFLIEYIPAESPDRYSVRQLDLRSGKVTPVGGKLKQPAPEEMRGTGRVQALAPDGNVLYTLYTRQVESYPHGRPIERDPTADLPSHSFVHVLNLEQGWAHCVDLPHPFGMSTTSDDAIGVSPDGSLLYVVDGTTAAVAKIDTGRLQVARTATIDLAPGRSDISAVVDRGSLFLSAGSELLELDADTLGRIELSTLDVSSNSLARSVEGRLFVGFADGVILFDTEAKRTVERYSVTGHLGFASL